MPSSNTNTKTRRRRIKEVAKEKSSRRSGLHSNTNTGSRNSHSSASDCHTPKAGYTSSSYPTLPGTNMNNIPSPSQQRRRQPEDDAASLVKTGLAFLGLSQSQQHAHQHSKHASSLSLMKVHHDSTDDDSDAVCFHDLNTIDNGNARINIGTRSKSQSQSQGNTHFNTKSSILIANGSCFVASDASTIVDNHSHGPHSLHSSSHIHDNINDNANHSGSGNGNGNQTLLNPLQLAAGLPPKTTKTKRRLQWRVGPLIKKGRSKSKSRARTGTRRSMDEVSLAERTVKSFHTAHSSETVQAGGNNQHHLNHFLRKGSNNNNNNKARTGNPMSMTKTTPVKKKYGDLGNVSSPNTVATVDEDEDNLSDSGTVVAAYDGEEEWEQSKPQRTIGLFLFDSESGRDHSAGASTPSNHDGKVNGNVNGNGNGLPPRAPNGKSKSHDGKETNTPPPPLNFDDDDEENAGGPLWQLAKLQAISEGIASPSPTPAPASSSQDDQTSPNTNTKNGKKSKRRFFSFSNKNENSSNDNQSILSSSSSQSELQRNQAERNLKAMHRLASQHLSFGEYNEAIDVLEEMLRGVQQMCGGERHYRVGTVLHNISTVHMRCRNYKEVVNVSRRAVEVRMKALGNHHPDVAISYAQLGMAHMELGEYQYAVLALRNALAIRNKRLSFRDRKIARLLNNIGCCLFELGKLQEASKAFEDVLKIQRMNMKHMGVAVAPSGLDGDGDASGVSQSLLGVASTLCNLGSIQLKLKSHKEALVHLEEALLIQQSVLGDGHPTVINTKDSIDFLNEEEISNLRSMIGTRTRSVQEMITYKMKQVGLHAPAESDKNSTTNNSKSGQAPPSFHMPSPMGLFTDVMSLNAAEWIQVLEEIGGAPIVCKGCTNSDWEDAEMPSNAGDGDSASFSKDLHWI